MVLVYLAQASVLAYLDQELVLDSLALELGQFQMVPDLDLA